MIIHLDHLALSPKNFDEDIKFIRLLGYNPVFIEKNIENLRTKKRFMREYKEKQDIALFTKKGSISFEIINHSNVSLENSFIIPVFENVDECYIKEVAPTKMAGFEINGCLLKHFDIPIYKITNKDAEFRCRQIFLRTSNIDNSIKFWETFGFVKKTIGNNFCILEFTSILTRDIYTAYVIANGLGGKYYLDNAGFNCVAFISNSIKKDKLQFNSIGLETTDIDTIFLNGRRLDVFFVKGPCGEIVEVINIYKTGRKGNI